MIFIMILPRRWHLVVTNASPLTPNVASKPLYFSLHSTWWIIASHSSFSFSIYGQKTVGYFWREWYEIATRITSVTVHATALLKKIQHWVRCSAFDNKAHKLQRKQWLDGLIAWSCRTKPELVGMVDNRSVSIICFMESPTLAKWARHTLIHSSLYFN